MPKPSTDPRIDLLPGQLRPVAEIVGVDGVNRLLDHFAGQEIYVGSPARAASSKIGLACGPGVARALSEFYEGRRIRIPLAQNLRTEAKHRAICADRRTANAVAKELGMHVDSVHRIRAGRGRRAEAAPDQRQQQLFPVRPR
jgi:hypothetical protein